MIKFFAYEDGGMVEKSEWQPHYWISVECPDDKDCEFLRTLHIPQSFMDNVADIDERPRFEREDGWLLTILRIPHHSDNNPLEYTTVPLGVMTKDELIVTVCEEIGRAHV